MVMCGRGLAFPRKAIGGVRLLGQGYYAEGYGIAGAEGDGGDEVDVGCGGFEGELELCEQHG